MRVLVAAWAGSTNLGDELVLAALLGQLRARGMQPTVLSVDPQGTRRVHGVDAVAGSDPRAVLAAAGEADLLLFGGGGLLQDETSPLNLPYHLSRVWAAAARRRRIVGIGLGAGRLDTRLGRALVRRTFARPLADRRFTVRDAASADLLAGLGLPRPVVAADLALSLPDVDLPAQDRVVVCLRPWSGRRGLLPAAVRARGAAGAIAPEPVLLATARELDDVRAATGLVPHLVALQADRDGPLHDAVAERMTGPVTTAVPDLAALPAEVASGRVVASMRFHGGVCAVLAGRPAVLIGYGPKVDSLAGDLGAGGRLLPWQPDGPLGLVAAVQAVLGGDEAVPYARARLRERERGNGELLDRLASPG